MTDPKEAKKRSHKIWRKNRKTTHHQFPFWLPKSLYHAIEIYAQQEGRDVTNQTIYLLKYAIKHRNREKLIEGEEVLS